MDPISNQPHNSNNNTGHTNNHGQRNQQRLIWWYQTASIKVSVMVILIGTNVEFNGDESRNDAPLFERRLFT